MSAPDDIDVREAAFLEALSKLTTEHRFVISGCGCCSSPRVEELTENDGPGPYRCGEHHYDDHLQWGPG